MVTRILALVGAASGRANAALRAIPPRQELPSVCSDILPKDILTPEWLRTPKHRSLPPPFCSIKTVMTRAGGMVNGLGQANCIRPDSGVEGLGVWGTMSSPPPPLISLMQIR